MSADANSFRPCRTCARPDDASALGDTLVTALTDITAALRNLASQAPPDPLGLLRAEQVAELLELPARTVRAQAAAGVIPHRRFGKHYRFSRDDVEAIVRHMSRPARARPASRRVA